MKKVITIIIAYLFIASIFAIENGYKKMYDFPVYVKASVNKNLVKKGDEFELKIQMKLDCNDENYKNSDKFVIPPYFQWSVYHFVNRPFYDERLYKSIKENSIKNSYISPISDEYSDVLDKENKYVEFKIKFKVKTEYKARPNLNKIPIVKFNEIKNKLGDVFYLYNDKAKYHPYFNSDLVVNIEGKEMKGSKLKREIDFDYGKTIRFNPNDSLKKPKLINPELLPDSLKKSNNKSDSLDQKKDQKKSESSLNNQKNRTIFRKLIDTSIALLFDSEREVDDTYIDDGLGTISVNNNDHEITFNASSDPGIQGWVAFHYAGDPQDEWYGWEVVLIENYDLTINYKFADMAGSHDCEKKALFPAELYV